MKYETTGELIHIGEVQEFGDKGFYKRVIVINTGGEYPQEVPFDAPKKAADACRQLQVGDQVTISFDLRGRHWKDDRWFASLNAWKIEKVGSKPAPRKEDAGQDDLPPAYEGDDTLDEDVPF